MTRVFVRERKGSNYKKAASLRPPHPPRTTARQIAKKILRIKENVCAREQTGALRTINYMITARLRRRRRRRRRKTTEKLLKNY